MRRSKVRWHGHPCDDPALDAGGSIVAVRAALYLRVSTGRQAEHDLSIPDQRAQSLAWLQQRGWTIVAEFLEPGASATDDKRPEFQRMIERACDGENAFDVIVVHSFSRFFRDAFGLEFYVRKLAKHGVRLVSITQELGDDPAQVMMRQVIALFDEYQSKENAKHVLRAMKENARQGFWNGSRPPLGYKTIEAERRGARVKKKLAIDPVEAEQVQLISAVSRRRPRLRPDGHQGHRELAERARATRTRLADGLGNWASACAVDQPRLYRPAALQLEGLQDLSAQGRSEHIFCDARAIVGSVSLRSGAGDSSNRATRAVTPPRVVTGPILLTGLAVCASCGGGMTLRAGTSHWGDVYRYYSCNTF